MQVSDSKATGCNSEKPPGDTTAIDNHGIEPNKTMPPFARPVTADEEQFFISHDGTAFSLDDFDT
jgi:hypothetical protein